MKFQPFFIFCFVALGQLSIVDCAGQQTIISSGAHVSDATGSVSYSIGQIDYQTHSGNGGSIAEGIQQPYEIFEIGIIGYEGIDLDCQVYPNPTSDKLQLRINNYEEMDLHFLICDMNGKQIIQQEIGSSHIEISIESLSKGTYFLNIMVEKQLARSFKIIKN